MPRRDHSGVHELGYMGIDSLYVEYDYSAAIPETGPSYASGGEPGEPAHVSVTRVYVKGTDHDQIDLTELFESAYLQTTATRRDGSTHNLYRPLIDDLADTVFEQVEADDD